MTQQAFAFAHQTRRTDRPPAAVVPPPDHAEDAALTGGFATSGGRTAQMSHADHAPNACVPGRPPAVIVNAYGDIDVTNAGTLTAYALVCAISGRGLIVDLAGVNFFGTEGFSALHRIAVGCARAATVWSFIPGVEADRLLRVCDPGGRLRAATTVAAALATVGHEIAAHQGLSWTSGRRSEPRHADTIRQ